MYTFRMITEKKADGFMNEQFFVISDTFLDEYLKKPLAQYLSVTLMGYFPRAAHHFMNRPKGCGTALLMYCSSGKGYYSINKEPWKILTAGQVLIIPPHTPHEYYASEDNPWTIYWTHFKGACFQPIYDMVASDLPVNIEELIGDRIKDLFHQCFCILQLPYHEEEFLYLCHLVTTMLALVSCAAKQSIIQLTLNGSQGMQQAIAFMQDHLHEEITLNQLAEAAHFSASHLYYLIKHSTGYAPVEFFLRTKIQASAKDLFFSTLPIKDIAASYGIEDPYYFSRLFKKIMGASPMNYRNKEQKITAV
jgi:AraC-like DNA-binding protein